MIKMFFVTLQSNHSAAVEVHVEPRLTDFGVLQKVEAVNPRSARADVAIDFRNHQWITFIDVTVIHPKPEAGKAPRDAIAAAHERKLDRYLPNYHLNPGQLQPMVFTTLGGWSEETRDFFQPILRRISGGDDQLFGKLWGLLRYRLACAIARAEGHLLNWLRRRNHVPGENPQPPSDEFHSEEDDPLDGEYFLGTEPNEEHDDLDDWEAEYQENVEEQTASSKSSLSDDSEMSASSSLQEEEDDHSTGAVECSEDDDESSSQEEPTAADGADDGTESEEKETEPSVSERRVYNLRPRTRRTGDQA